MDGVFSLEVLEFLAAVTIGCGVGTAIAYILRWVSILTLILYLPALFLGIGVYTLLN